MSGVIGSLVPRSVIQPAPPAPGAAARPAASGVSANSSPVVDKAADWLAQAIPTTHVPAALLKQADEMGIGATGAMFTPSIPVDAFNNVVWNDVHSAPNPFGTQGPWGDQSQPMRTPADIAAAASGAVAAAGAMRGSTHVSPWDVAMVAGTAAGKGYLGGMVLGKTVGALAGLSPAGQQQVRQLGMWGGLLTGAVRATFGR